MSLLKSKGTHVCPLGLRPKACVAWAQSLGLDPLDALAAEQFIITECLHWEGPFLVILHEPDADTRVDLPELDVRVVILLQPTYLRRDVRAHTAIIYPGEEPIHVLEDRLKPISDAALTIALQHCWQDLTVIFFTAVHMENERAQFIHCLR